MKLSYTKKATGCNRKLKSFINAKKHNSTLKYIPKHKDIEMYIQENTCWQNRSLNLSSARLLLLRLSESVFLLATRVSKCKAFNWPMVSLGWVRKAERRGLIELNVIYSKRIILERVWFSLIIKAKVFLNMDKIYFFGILFCQIWLFREEVYGYMILWM